MQSWKNYIPIPIKLFLKIILQSASDFFNGRTKIICTAKNIRQHLPVTLKQIVSIEQEIKINDTSANKIHNLSLAINKINNIEIAPGHIFSFWKLAGEPSKKNGYIKSRSIVGGELEAAIGGGLCQLSGLIYFLSLQTGLTILERHQHSIDIYKNEERFTPLGSDATVSYGYKDFRFTNNFKFPVYLSFKLTNNLLTGTVLATENIELCTIKFEYKKHNTFIQVKTICTSNRQSTIIANNNYALLKQ